MFIIATTTRQTLDFLQTFGLESEKIDIFFVRMALKSKRMAALDLIEFMKVDFAA